MRRVGEEFVDVFSPNRFVYGFLGFSSPSPSFFSKYPSAAVLGWRGVYGWKIPITHLTIAHLISPLGFYVM